MERGLSILWIDAICGSVQNSMTPLKRTWSVWSGSLRSTNGAAIGRYSASLAEAERLRQRLLADAGRRDSLKTVLDRVELRRNSPRMIQSLVPLTSAAARPTECKVASSPESFRCGSSVAG